MKWRCTWCGKPHAENDPPCDNCGHNAFEKAIVREDERSESSGEATAEASSDATGDIDPETGTVDTGTSYVWRCQNCGRDHVKFNPPCSRCGEHALEKVEQRYDDLDDELETSSWLEVAKPYTPILAAVLVIVALFATGIVPLSVIPGIGAPAPPDAPGEGTEAAGIDLEATEREVHERLEEERDAARTYDDDLAAFAEYNNRAAVRYQYEGERSESVEPSDFGVDCSPVRGDLIALPFGDADSEAELGAAVAEALATNDEVTTDGYDAEAVDLRVVDDSVYVYYATC